MSNTTKSNGPEAGANISRTAAAYEKWPAWENRTLQFDSIAEASMQIESLGRQGFRVIAVLQGTDAGRRPIGITIVMERPFGMNWREGVQPAGSVSEPQPTSPPSMPVPPYNGTRSGSVTSVNGNSSRHGGRGR